MIFATGHTHSIFTVLHFKLKLTPVSEVEGTAGKALLQNAHYRDEHLGADVRVELKILVNQETRDFFEGLLHEVFYFALLKFSLLLVHVFGVTSSLSIVHALACAHHTVGRVAALVLIR